MASALDLLDCPDELLVYVLGFLDSRTDLLHCAQVCKRLQRVAEPFIYHTIVLEGGSATKSLLEAIRLAPSRAGLIKNLKIVPSKHRAHGIEDVPQLLLYTRNVQDLVIGSPFCGYGWDAESTFWVAQQDRCRDVFLKASWLGLSSDIHPLQRLRSCKLDYLGEDKPTYTFAKHAVMFLHPTLTSLEISCAMINAADISFLRPYRRCSPLSSLHLNHCDVSASALSVLLSVPKALEVLKIQDIDGYDIPTDEPIQSHDLVEALEPHRHSLKTLLVGVRSLMGTLGESLQFTAFSSLQNLEIEGKSDRDPLPKMLRNPFAHDSLSTLTFSDLLPRFVLRTLRLVRDELDTPQMAGLRKVVLRTRPGATVHRSECNEMEEVGRTLKKAGIQLLIVRLTRARNAVPPYLHGEYVPEEVVAHDSFAPDRDWDFDQQCPQHNLGWNPQTFRWDLDFDLLAGDDVGVEAFDFDIFLNTEGEGEGEGEGDLSIMPYNWAPDNGA